MQSVSSPDRPLDALQLPTLHQGNTGFLLRSYLVLISAGAFFQPDIPNPG